ncbi:DJ-1/PfpI family protein [Demequina sp. SYSU T00192]|uniref:DJ-1/PfpI family protein n=1 Tax=Demequina litoralis TaxID=3051660 RepID=A0ABT8G835_9MICO|nr:DJ-1/PfpI family protein [Demequina sp. SYSU T00192]MDN4475293.1 DJ-1/PfpI family protein [Demequina sp. SYSU T00192]
MPTRALILLYDGFDLIDAGGPYEVLLTAARLLQRDGLAPEFEVVLATPGGGDVTAFGGMTLTRLVDSDTVDACDVLIVPGTIDVACAVGDGVLIETVERLSRGAAMTASVCTGAFLLARAGLLDDAPATTHWEDLSDLASCGEVGSVVADVRWVDNGGVLTSGGLTSGIHLALHLVARVSGTDLAVRTARQLDMDWSPDPAR